MGYTTIVLVFVIGFSLGFIIASILKKSYSNTAKEIANELLARNENKLSEERDRFFERVKDSFSTLSMEALRSSSDQFLKMAKEKIDSERELNSKDLESKKHLIDQQLQTMNSTKHIREQRYCEAIRQFQELPWFPSIC